MSSVSMKTRRWCGVWTGSRNCFGREFHVVGPATEKARRPF